MVWTCNQSHVPQCLGNSCDMLHVSLHADMLHVHVPLHVVTCYMCPCMLWHATCAPACCDMLHVSLHVDMLHVDMLHVHVDMLHVHVDIYLNVCREILGISWRW